MAHVKSYSVTDICLYSTSEELSRCSAETFTFTFTFLIPGWGSFPEQPTIRTSVRIISILRSTALQAAHHGEEHKRSERHHSAHSLDAVVLMQMIFVKFFLMQMNITAKLFFSCLCVCFCRIQSGSYLSTGWFTLILAMDMCKEIHIYGMINDTYCK